MRQRKSERGSALLLVTIIVIILVGISLAYASFSWWNSRRAYQDESAAQALYVAESAAAIYFVQQNAPNPPLLPPAVAKTQIGGANGSYWVAAENLVNFADATVVGNNNQDPNFFAFQVAGKFNQTTRHINVLMTHSTGGVFWNAIYAGNSANDPNYNLGLSGKTVNGVNVGDTVIGNVYSGGKVSADSYASIYNMNGGASGATVDAVGGMTNTMTNTSVTTTNTVEPSLSIPRTFGPNSNMLEAEYNATQRFSNSSTFSENRDPSTGIAWVDVAGQFAAHGTANDRWVDGSYATDIRDPNNPAHIFRKDPSSTSGAGNNRTTTYEWTAPSAKSDFYIEDPTSTAVTQTMLDGGQHPVNGDTTASMVNIHEQGNNAVYFLDGNLRVSGEPIKSYQLNPDPSLGGPVKMTMVVKGNVSLTDNLLYPSWMSKTDAVAIIAVVDPNFPNTTAANFVNSGNILPAAFQNKTGLRTAQDFVNSYNTRAQSARNAGLHMDNIDLSTQAGQAKASQEYNKIYGSGNVFFGDPGSGTVEHFEAFMYAENNFYATNLDTTTSSGGTSKMEIYGNMTAGNQVNINRTSASVGYVPLSVTFDQAIMTAKGPPGLPQTPQIPGQPWRILSWKQSAMSGEASNANEK